MFAPLPRESFCELGKKESLPHLLWSAAGKSHFGIITGF